MKVSPSCKGVKIKFLDKHDILFKNHNGFRAGRSTKGEKIELIDKISLPIERNEYTIGILLDLSKAFDTVNHEILLHKLENYGLEELHRNGSKIILRIGSK